MICSLALLGISIAIPVNQISVEIAPCSLKVALEKLAPHLDRPWIADEKMGQEIVFIQTRELDQASLQKHIATATGGVWINQQGKDVLTLPAWLEKQQQEEMIQERTRLILKSQAERRQPKPFTRAHVESWLGQLELTVRNMNDAYRKDYVSFDKARQQHFELLTQGPVARLLERIINRLDMRVLATMEPAQQICFSNTPNRTEKSLGFDIVPLLAQFSAEQKLVKTVLPSGKEFEVNTVTDRRAFTLGADPEVHRVLVVVTMRRGSSMPSINLKVLDKDGWITGSISVQLNVSHEPPQLVMEAPERTLSLTTRTRDWPNVLTWLGTDLSKDYESKKPLRGLLAPWLPSLLRPEEVDPLELSVGDILTAYSESRAKNLVALLPDRSITWRAPNSDEMNVSDFEAAYSNLWRLRRLDEKQTIVLRPKLYSEQRAERMKRAALGKLLRRVDLLNGVLVQHAAEYLWNSGSQIAFEFTNFDSLARGFGEKIQGSFESKALTSWYQRAPLRFIGSLSENQRKGLLAGGEITASQLSSTALVELNRMFYSQDSIDDFFKPFVRNGTVRDYLGHASDLIWERLPNGIPSTTRIVCQKTVEPAIVQVEDDGLLLTSVTPEWLGERLIQYEDEGVSKEEVTFQLGKANTYNLKFVFPNTAEATVKLSEIVPGKRQEVKGLNGLPTEFRELVEKSMAAERKRREESKNKANQGTGTPPPLNHR